ncbi:hypothetical protein V7147_23380 [Bacillus sp. JJ1521]|uniref:hypothetical protein n=1 Tax=Bacillus sp. JJ1521 TaxID=3122957 RepID=UPI002FFD7748
MCFESGENKEVLQKLLKYESQQVVVNWYEDELLTARDGFFFSHIQREDDLLIFMKEHQVKQIIPLSNYETLETLSDFRDFFQLTNRIEVLHIYFPH